MKHLNFVVYPVVIFLCTSEITNAADSAVPEPFQRSDESSKYTISYADLTALLKMVVVDVGRSTREKVAPSQAATGTRMQTKVKRSTLNEGNRFYYETFEDNEQGRQQISNIQKSIELVPAEVPLEFFSRDEQLAYWLNLYNVTVLNEIIKVYPKRNLKKMLVGKKSFLSKKLLTVAGVPLSLDDIQFTILKQNYAGNPLIMYGLYQGNIGGPNIRKNAYTGDDVYRALNNNAIDFVNSNRGTAAKDEKVFRVSTLYDRNRVYFPNFQSDLYAHLLKYIEGYEITDLQEASSLKADITDWTVTDLGGTYRDLGASFAYNNAAMLDSIKSTVGDGTGGIVAAASGYGSNLITSRGKKMSRYSPELLTHLQDLNLKRANANSKNANVTMEELGQVTVESGSESDSESDSEKDN